MSGAPTRRCARAAATLTVVLAAAAGAPLGAPLGATLGAQRPPASRAPVLEARADLLAARATTVHAGGGVLWPAGRYVQAGLVLGGGVTHHEAARADDGVDARDETVGSARAEVVVRFEVDPLADPFTRAATPSRWLLYGSAGGGALLSRGASPQSRVFVALGVAGPDRGGWRPALELGLGGGVRVGVALRRSTSGRDD